MVEQVSLTYLLVVSSILISYHFLMVFCEIKLDTSE